MFGQCPLSYISIHGHGRKFEQDRIGHSRCNRVDTDSPLALLLGSRLGHADHGVLGSDVGHIVQVEYAQMELELGLLDSSLETNGLHTVLLTRLFDALAEQSAHREVRCKWVIGTCRANIEGLSRKDYGHQH